MQRRYLSFVLIILLAVLAGWMVNPKNKGISIPFLGYSNDMKVKQGLDLQGGIQFLLQARCPDSNPKCDINTYLPATIQNIQSRVSGGLGVSEAVVTSQNDNSNYYISVELPGIKDDKEALALIGTTGLLQFIDSGGQALPACTNFNQACPSNTNVTTQINNKTYPVVFTGSQLDVNSIATSFNQAGSPQIDFSFAGDAKTQFADYTLKNVGKYLTIVLDGNVIESAVIQSQITGQGEISGGSMTVDDANRISSILRYGSLPLPLSLASERQISATLGAQAINYTQTAAFIGLALVILFMLVYYRLPGFVATLALGLYAALMFSLIKLLGVVLTVAGIAGVILSIGMAVDANILIFERIKEELRGGRTLTMAIEYGWKRAWPSIRDSNASTIITCAILALFGSNFGATIIVGFATNLLIGVLTSLFTAVVVTRTLLTVILGFTQNVFKGMDNSALFGLPRNAINIPSYQRKARVAVASSKLALAGGASSVSGDEDEEDEDAEDND
jgi:preprotein translocase subunit SecD